MRLIGFGDDVLTLLAGVDVLCLLSGSRGNPFALLEALVAGLPSVATTVGAPKPSASRRCS